MGVSSKSSGETPDLMLYPQPPSFKAFTHCPPKNTNSLATKSGLQSNASPGAKVHACTQENQCLLNTPLIARWFASKTR